MLKVVKQWQSKSLTRTDIIQHWGVVETNSHFVKIHATMPLCVDQFIAPNRIIISSNHTMAVPISEEQTGIITVVHLSLHCTDELQIYSQIIISPLTPN